MTLSPWRCNSLIPPRTRSQCISLRAVVTVIMLQIVIVILANAVTSQAASTACPSACTCDTIQNRVICSNGGTLLTILADVPLTTYSLVINGASSTGTLQESHMTALISSAIKELTISESQIQSIGENAFAQLPNLRKLNLSSNAITSLSKSAFSTLYSLETLDLSSNRIASLQGILNSASQLRHLYLAANHISELPTGALRKLARLESLVLDHNNLATLGSSALQGLSNLQYLSLKNCQITNLPQRLFYSVRNLRTLHLEHNYLSSLPDNNELRNLASLAGFHVDNNRINHISDHQFNGWNVDFLSISRNQIKTIGTNTLNHFNAKHVDLSYNRISSIGPYAFKSLAPELRTLDLAGNQLNTLSITSLEGLYRLQTLNLSNCNLVSLPVNLFTSLRRLSIVDLSSNKLTNLSKPLLEGSSNFRHFSLRRNSWYCDCDIAPLREWLQKDKNRAKFFCYANEGTVVQTGCVNDIKCSKPRAMSGQDIQSLDPPLITECHEVKEGNDDSSYRDTLIIVFTIASVLIIAAIAMGVLVWRKRQQNKIKGKKKMRQPPPMCIPTTLLNGCTDKTSFDVGSINESDRDFALRNYMHNLHMLNGQYYDLSPNPSYETKGSVRTWSQSVRDTPTTGGSDNPSAEYIGRESAV